MEEKNHIPTRYQSLYNAHNRLFLRTKCTAHVSLIFLDSADTTDEINEVVPETYILTGGGGDSALERTERNNFVTSATTSFAQFPHFFHVIILTIPMHFEDPGMWITKMSHADRAIGIRVFSNNSTLTEDVLRHVDNHSQKTTFVVQRYLEPLLIDGYKFDIRQHILVRKQVKIQIPVSSVSMYLMIITKSPPPGDKSKPSCAIHQ